MSIYFVGDSTWTYLFPSVIKYNFGFESFNVLDFDKDDKKFKKEYFNAFNTTLFKWDILIGCDF